MRWGMPGRIGFLLLAAVAIGCATEIPSRIAAPGIRFASATAGYAYRERVAEQVAVEGLERDAQALRFRLKSFIMRDALGDDEVLSRASWAVPLGVTVRGGAQYLAVITTRCVIDYRYPLNKKMPRWSNLALFSGVGPPPNRQDIGSQVFRIGYPSVLPGVTVDYDPKRDAWFVTDRRYLEGPAGERYFKLLKTGSVPSASAELVLGDWDHSNGVDLTVVQFPLSDPGLASLRPERNLGLSDPLPALRSVFEPRLSFWGDTFNFEVVSTECMKHAQADYANVDRERQTWRALAIVAGVALAATLFAPELGAIVGDPKFVQRLARGAGKQALNAMWRSVTTPFVGSAARGAYWNQFGKLVVRLALADGSIREYVVAGLHRLGLSPQAAEAVITTLQGLLAEPGAKIAAMDRATGMPTAAVMAPSRQLDFAAELIRSGTVRLDVTDTEVLSQQPTLVQLAQQAVADPTTATALVQDAAYRWALSEAARASAQP